MFPGQPGLLHPENPQLPTSRLFTNHSRTSDVVLWSNHANFARGSTAPLIRDVEMEEEDTEGGEKDKVQWDDFTDERYS